MRVTHHEHSRARLDRVKWLAARDTDRYASLLNPIMEKAFPARLCLIFALSAKKSCYGRDFITVA
jgi:hypothetical protein